MAIDLRLSPGASASSSGDDTGGDELAAIPEPGRDLAGHPVQEFTDFTLLAVIIHAAMPPPVQDIDQPPLYLGTLPPAELRWMGLQLYFDAPIAVDGGEAGGDAGSWRQPLQILEMLEQRLQGGLRVAFMKEGIQVWRLQRCAVEIEADDACQLNFAASDKVEVRIVGGPIRRMRLVADSHTVHCIQEQVEDRPVLRGGGRSCSSFGHSGTGCGCVVRRFEH